MSNALSQGQPVGFDFSPLGNLLLELPTIQGFRFDDMGGHTTLVAPLVMLVAPDIDTDKWPPGFANKLLLASRKDFFCDTVQYNVVKNNPQFGFEVDGAKDAGSNLFRKGYVPRARVKLTHATPILKLTARFILETDSNPLFHTPPNACGQDYDITLSSSLSGSGTITLTKPGQCGKCAPQVATLMASGDHGETAVVKARSGPNTNETTMTGTPIYDPYGVFGYVTYSGPAGLQSSAIDVWDDCACTVPAGTTGTDYFMTIITFASVAVTF